MKKNLHGKSLNDIRRPTHMPTKVTKPKKGNGYKRHSKHKKETENE
jgi:hypothetical protein